MKVVGSSVNPEKDFEIFERTMLLESYCSDPVPEISMDIAAMLTKDAGLVVEDDYTKEKLSREGIIMPEEEGV